MVNNWHKLGGAYSLASAACPAPPTARPARRPADQTGEASRLVVDVDGYLCEVATV